MKVIYEAFFIVTALVSNPVLSASSDHEDHDSLRVRGFQPRHDRAMRSKSSKKVCIDYAELEEAKGSKAASSPTGIVGVAVNPEDSVIGTQWTANAGNYPALYNSATDDKAVVYKLTEDYHSTGKSALCINNQCPSQDICGSQKGYLQFYYDGVFANAAASLPYTGGITGISSSDFKYLSYDIFPIDCGAAGVDDCGQAFYVAIRFVHDFSSCGFFDCSFDYHMPAGQKGPEDTWTTIRIDANSKPWRIRQSGGCDCPFVSGKSEGEVDGISINEALSSSDGEAFAGMILGTGYGEIASLSMGAEVGGDDSLLHGCFDNIIFSTESGSQVFDFERA